MCGSENPLSCSSIRITVHVSAKHGPDTVTEIKYSVSLKGVISDKKNITIKRSISSSDDDAGMF